jgi:hypothetical protein
LRLEDHRASRRVLQCDHTAVINAMHRAKILNWHDLS